MANYQSTKRLETEIEGLRNTRGGGLLQALRNMEQRKLEKQLGVANENNDNLRNQELAMLLRGDQTGRVGDSYVARRADQFVPRHPELIEALRNRSQEQPSNVQEWEYFDKLPKDKQEQYLTVRRGTSPINLGDRYEIPSQTRPGTSLGQFDVGVRPQDDPALRGDQEAARQDAITQALPGQLAIETDDAVRRANGLAQAPIQRDAQATLSLLDMAEPLLETATGSGVGALRDQIGGVFGMSGEGAESAAQLKAIGGLLISKMPRMQGPQSNLDVQLYREMAGQIGDPTVPNDVRRAAIATIRALNEKYAGQSGATETAPAPAPVADPITAADEILRRAGIIQ